MEPKFKPGDFVSWHTDNSMGYNAIWYVEFVDTYYSCRLVSNCFDTSTVICSPDLQLYLTISRIDEVCYKLPDFEHTTTTSNICKCPIFELMNLGCKCGGK